MDYNYMRGIYFPSKRGYNNTMQEISIKLESGIVKYNLYSSDDFMNMNHMRGLVFDIYDKIKYNRNIYVILSIKPNKDKDFRDVLKEFSLLELEGNNLVFAQAGTLTRNNIGGNIIDGIRSIKNERDILFDSAFVNIIFNRPMYHVYSNPDIFILSNEIGDSFISDNIGIDDTHMINRVNSK